MAKFGKYCIVKLCGKVYEIDNKIASYIFSKLENKKIENLTSSQFEEYLKKYDLLDEYVLNNLSDI